MSVYRTIGPTLVFDHLVPCNVGFDSSATLDMRVHAWGEARGQNLEHLRFFFVSFFFL